MDIEKILLIIKIIYNLIKYDFEIVDELKLPLYKENRFVKIYKINDHVLQKQIKHYTEYYITPLLINNFKIPLFGEKSFANRYIIYCISLITKWITLQNRQQYNMAQLPCIWELDKSNLSYKEELVKTIPKYNDYWTKENVDKQIKIQLDRFNNNLEKNKLYFVFMDRKNMGIDNKGNIKIIEGELWKEQQFITIKKIINKWCPSYKFIPYENYNRIYS